MKFAYKAFRADGSIVSGSVAAGSRPEAEQELRSQGLFPESVTTADLAGDPSKTRRPLISSSRLRWLGAFTRQMTVLSAGGCSVVEALAAAERQTADPKWRSVIADVRAHVENGESLSDAMARHPRVFDDVFRSLIASGESGGEMRSILERLTAMTRQQTVTRNAVTGAMVYPVLLLTVSVSVLIGLVIQVLPRFAELFETLNAPIPPSTAVLLAVSNTLRDHTLLIAGALAVAIGGLIWYARTQAGRIAAQRIAVSAPFLGSTVRSFILARIARVLGVLLDARVPLLEAIEIATASAKNHGYVQLMTGVRAAVERGENMSEALAGSALIPEAFSETVRNGEQSGQMGEVMVVLADMMDEDNQMLLRSLTSVLEPLILTVLGLLVGGVALSLFLPLFDLTASTGAGP
ncbi:MAG: type II secretion system F family protein [Planctomycetota bacterium]